MVRGEGISDARVKSKRLDFHMLALPSLEKMGNFHQSLGFKSEWKAMKFAQFYTNVPN